MILKNRLTIDVLVYILVVTYLINILIWLYMSKLISLAEFAREIGTSRQYVSKLVREGKLSTSDGKIIKTVALKEYETLKKKDVPVEEENTPQRKTNTQDTNNTGKAIQQAKAVKETYIAKLRRREYEILEKHYIHIDQIVNEIETASAIVRSKLLALPNKLCTELEGLTHHEIQSILEDEINKCFQDLTDLSEEYKELQIYVKEKEPNKT